jgi:cytochrome P450 family 9
MLPHVVTFLGFNFVTDDIFYFFKRVIADTMREREEKNISRPDVIQLLIQARKNQLKNPDEEDREFNQVASKRNIEFQYKDEDWIAQGLILFFAGFDTSKDGLQLTIYELALNQDIQQTLYEEIEGVLENLNESPISYEVLNKMKFLDMVVSESLRKWPPIPLTDRNCSKDCELNLENGKKILIRKNTMLIFPIFLIQRDPDYFENPEKFDPYRFSDERKGTIAPGTLVSFGSGPRACIGSRFALMSLKLFLFKLLSEFRIEKGEKTPENLTFALEFTLKFKEIIYLNFIPRK